MWCIPIVVYDILYVCDTPNDIYLYTYILIPIRILNIISFLWRKPNKGELNVYTHTHMNAYTHTHIYTLMLQGREMQMCTVVLELLVKEYYTAYAHLPLSDITYNILLCTHKIGWCLLHRRPSPSAFSGRSIFSKSLFCYCMLQDDAAIMYSLHYAIVIIIASPTAASI